MRMEKETYIYAIENAIEEDEDEEEMTIGEVHNHDFQNKKWKSLWLYMRLLDVKRFFDDDDDEDKDLESVAFEWESAAGEQFMPSL